MMELGTPEEKKQARCEEISRTVLQNDYVSFEIENFTLRENLREDISVVQFTLISDDPELNGVVKSSGRGLVDALFNGLLTHLSSSFYSLENLHFEDFAVKIALKEGVVRSRADAPVEIRLTMATSQFNRVYFRHKSRSMVSAAIEVVRKTVEYFVNMELAVVQIQENIHDAKERRRPDIINVNTAKLTELVSIISYEKTFEKINSNGYNSD